jgi:hypothetical protein
MSWVAVGSIGGAVVSSLLAPKPNDAAGEAAARAAGVQSQISWAQWQNYLENYAPLEKELIAEARKTGSAEEIAAAEGRAAGDVTNAFSIANRSAANRQRAYGINPASPAASSEATSMGLSEGAAGAGARTMARENQKKLAYDRQQALVSIGRGIPAQASASAAGAASSAGLWQNSINAQYGQNQQNQQNIGYALQPLIGAARQYFYGARNPSGETEYADGGKVGLNTRKTKLHIAVKKAMTPHMSRTGYANGGGVGMQGLEPSQMNRVLPGPGTETSDSIPAVIDGQTPAALSSNEFVMNAEVPKLSGEEILQAINRAGLEKRSQGTPSNAAGLA